MSARGSTDIARPTRHALRGIATCAPSPLLDGVSEKFHEDRPITVTVEDFDHSRGPRNLRTEAGDFPRDPRPAPARVSVAAGSLRAWNGRL